MRKVVAKRRLSYDDVAAAGVGKQEEAFMKVNCLELQKKILLMTQSKLEKEIVNEDLRHAVLKKQRRLIDMQVHREERLQRQMGILNEEEKMNNEFFEAMNQKAGAEEGIGESDYDDEEEVEIQ